ncbi:UDP-glucose/GDP-mannose dehydrogenase family protein [archaeon]|jgi:UDPglucose 6-dehydrogenase|nr:UDP-glucose/GDP-mannose dehydrogenase family protein [archaeon]MBT6762437.1 UDP-glucose/GDP-mannose dehydrogenase family protein [archaeon]
MNITIFGTGYVGLVTGACLAKLGHTVICVDIDEAKLTKIAEGNIPFFEPGLSELVKLTQAKEKLFFTTEAKAAIQKSNVIFNCVGTPQHSDGRANLTYVKEVAKTVAIHAKGKKILINKSTVPPGTAKACQDLIKETNSESQVEVVSNPEFLKEGAAIHDFTHPDKIVIGCRENENSDWVKQMIRKVYLGRTRMYIPFLETSLESAEIIKYANNAFLATKISFINELANICDAVGADVKVAAQAMGMDYRISAKFLNAGIGYGGSCFPKDVRALVNKAKQHGYDAKLLDQVDKTNQTQKLQIIKKIESVFNSDLSGKTFAILGLSFKPKTSDMRESPSLTIIPELIKRGAKVQAYDPIATEEAKHALDKELHSSITFCDSIGQAVEKSDAILLLTEWDEFRSLNFSEIKDQVKQKIIFDGRNIYEPEIIAEEGFSYIGIGRK